MESGQGSTGTKQSGQKQYRNSNEASDKPPYGHKVSDYDRISHCFQTLQTWYIYTKNQRTAFKRIPVYGDI